MTQSSTELAATLPVGAILIRLGAATGLGLVIGFERELRERGAGLRTHALIALAAALFSVTAETMIAELRGPEDRTQLDPIRVVEAVTAGVAFLAAGAIIQRRDAVRGLTTGAAMWLAGSVGLACGLGLYAVGVAGTAIAVLVLAPLRLLERALGARER